MSRSQFQSKRFILRHAWLNLWDERMTTGRINQVAIHYIPPSPPSHAENQHSCSLDWEMVVSLIATSIKKQEAFTEEVTRLPSLPFHVSTNSHILYLSEYYLSKKYSTWFSRLVGHAPGCNNRTGSSAHDGATNQSGPKPLVHPVFSSVAFSITKTKLTGRRN